MLQADLRHAVRQLGAKPGFTVVVLLTLALGVGVNTAIFSLVWGLLLRPFPFADPDRLVAVQTVSTRVRGNVLYSSLADLEDWRQARSFRALAAYSTSRVNLVGDGPALPVEQAAVTPELFTALGIAPRLGRTFTADEDRPGGDVHKAILGHALWRSRFNGDPTIVGRRIRTAATTYEVVGVMPEHFGFPHRTALWVPVESQLALRQIKRLERRAGRGYTVLGRLAAGVSLDAANAELAAIGGELARTYPDTNEELRPQAITLREAEVGTIQPYLLLLAGAVALVLLVCCANIANLLLVRFAGRAREFSVRTALGASPGRLVRQLLAECGVLSLAGGVLGLAVAGLLVRALPVLIPVPLPSWARVELSGAALLFTLAVSLVTTLLFGLVPALTAARLNLAEMLREGSRGSRRGGWLRPALVVGEVALSLVLLVAASLLVQSLWRLQRVEPGFRAENLLTVVVSPYRPGTNEQRIDSVGRFYRDVIARLEQLPGVVAVGGTDNFPFTGARGERNMASIEARGEGGREALHRAPVTLIDITPRYFEAMGIPLREGRAFTERDTRTSQQVIILSERTARTLFGTRGALGREVRYNNSGDTDPWATVVGVVGNVKHRATDSEQVLELYYPYTQYGLGTAHLAVRLQGGAQGLESQIRQAVAAVDSETAVDEIKPMTELIADTLWQQRLWGLLLAAFAGLALLLAALGLYGVMAHAVSERTREIGIRLAIGAQPSRVLALVTGEGMRLVAVGVVLGLGGALVVSRVLGSLLWGVAATDVATYAGVPLVLATVALAACVVPAWRASRIDPLVALRNE